MTTLTTDRRPTDAPGDLDVLALLLADPTLSEEEARRELGRELVAEPLPFPAAFVLVRRPGGPPRVVPLEGC